jgi:hypothetical protein
MRVRCGSDGYFQYDACARCGYAICEYWEAQADGWKLVNLYDNDVWGIITKAEQKSRRKIYAEIIKLPDPIRDGPKQVFKYEKEKHYIKWEA